MPHYLVYESDMIGPEIEGDKVDFFSLEIKIDSLPFILKYVCQMY